MQLYCIFNSFVDMKLAELKKILSNYDLRNTSCRYDVLNYFLNSGYALTPKDLEEELPKYDRVTLYRTLNTFIDKGLIHKIPSDSGIARYALSDTHKQKKEEHIHFKCEDCGRTECLTEYNIPSVKIPNGYQLSSVNLIVTGKCNSCNH